MTAGSFEIEAVDGIRPEVDAAISAALNSCITETNLGVGKQYIVRCDFLRFRVFVTFEIVSSIRQLLGCHSPRLFFSVPPSARPFLLFCS